MVLKPAPPSTRMRPAGRRELAIVFRSIAALVSAGVPLERAVAATEPLGRGALREVLAEARARLREGRTLAQALANDSGVVPPLVVGMLAAGERGSQLGRALEQVAAQLEREADLVGRVRQALAYPAVLAVVGAASVIMIATTVVPKFAELLADVGADLPTSTRVLLEISGFIAGNGIVLGLLVAGGVAAVGAWARAPRGQLMVARGLLALPLVGSLRQALATARWGRALSGMLETGMPLLSALAAARDATGDPALAERLDRVHARVAEGQGLTASLEREAAIGSSALQLVAVGESSGALARMAERAGDLAATEADRALNVLVSLLEPGLVVVFGGVVAFVAAALLQAVYSLKPV
jgi:type II secretory pathway component PulF